MEPKERHVQIKIISRQLDSNGELPDEILNLILEKNDGSVPQNLFSDKIELITEGTVRDNAGRIELEYEETELTGMEGATTIVSYEKENPGIITVLRDGSVCTALVFEEGMRHICTYETPYMPFELCVATIKLSNSLSYESGSIELDYMIETGGERAERTRLSLSLMN